ncbi:hypothetical protein MKEN_00670300 [Mycena kentingensis (nom. inval.)]|nr:hypothetical protein MKEN_00670300 [Mycena kentingensis (nom. inval.)]
MRPYFHRCLHTSTRRPPVFVFDIDGVLIRGPHVLPAAKRALSILEGDNPFRQKIPYILLTNGGGVGERERCQNLTKKLGVQIDPEQYIQAHTILKTRASQYKDSSVLVLGGKLDAIRNVASDYGFQNPLTTLDVLAWNPSQRMAIPSAQSCRGSVYPGKTTRCNSYIRLIQEKPFDFSKTPISAIFVYHDPRNWALDIQVICDVIQSEGRIGGPYVPVKDQKHPVELVFCNPDLIWKSEFDRPRLGQGGFKAAFQGVFKALTGADYPHVQFGKPSRPTYDFAAEVLRERLMRLGRIRDPVPRIYMVGDNPESDIAGANGAGWESILVRTGVFSGGEPSHRPTYQAEDVEEAVRFAIAREMGEL